MTKEESALLAEAIQAMSASEPIHALTSVNRLVSALWEGRAESPELKVLWEPFRTLLQRRGYFVSTPPELRGTLEEIRALGEGFDLYELARALAEADTTSTDCLRLRPDRSFPDLIPFSPVCPCGKHPEPRR